VIAINNIVYHYKGFEMKLQICHSEGFSPKDLISPSSIQTQWGRFETTEKVALFPQYLLIF